MDLHLRPGIDRPGQKANHASPCEAIQRWQLKYVVWFQTPKKQNQQLTNNWLQALQFPDNESSCGPSCINMSIDTNSWPQGWRRTYDRHKKHRGDNGLCKQSISAKTNNMKHWNPPISGSNWLSFAIVLRNDESARLNDPSGSVFILEMSDCKIISFVAMVVDRDFDPLCDLRRDKCLVWQYNDPREVTPMAMLVAMFSKLLSKIIYYTDNSPKTNDKPFVRSPF